MDVPYSDLTFFKTRFNKLFGNINTLKISNGL